MRDRLVAEAAALGVPLATHAARVLSGAGQAAPRADGDVVNEVLCVFTGLPLDAGLRREVCLSLARTVEAGGTAGIAAARALLDEVSLTERLYSAEDEDED